MVWQGKNKVIRRPEQPEKNDVPGMREGVLSEQFDQRIIQQILNSKKKRCLLAHFGRAPYKRTTRLSFWYPLIQYLLE